MAESDSYGGLLIALVVGVAAAILGKLLTGDTSASELQQNAQGLAPSGGGSPVLVVPSERNPDTQTQAAGEGTTRPGQSPQPERERNPDRRTSSGAGGGGGPRDAPEPATALAPEDSGMTEASEDLVTAINLRQAGADPGGPMNTDLSGLGTTTRREEYGF